MQVHDFELVGDRQLGLHWPRPEMPVVADDHPPDPDDGDPVGVEDALR